MICGIDVGMKRSIAAIISGREIRYLGEWREDLRFHACGIDSPLSFSDRPFRDCDRYILDMGIPIFPVNMKIMKELTRKGIEIAEKAKMIGEVYEVYPYATRYILGCKENKKRREGRKRITEFLNKFVDIDFVLNHHEIDAITSAITVKLYKEGKGKLVGEKCKILIPSIRLIR